MPCASPRLDRNKGNGYNCPCICARRCILLYSSWLEHGNVVVARFSIFGSTDPPSVALVVKFHVFVTQVSQGLYIYIYINVICDIGREYDIRIKLLGYPLSTKSKPSAELGDYLNFFLGSGYSYYWHTNPASDGKIEPPIRNELRGSQMAVYPPQQYYTSR